MSKQQRLVSIVAFLKLKCETVTTGKAVVFVSSRKESTFYEMLLRKYTKPVTATERTKQANAANIEQLMGGVKQQREGEDEESPVLGDVPLFFLHGGYERRQNYSLTHPGEGGEGDTRASHTMLTICLQLG